MSAPALLHFSGIRQRVRGAQLLDIESLTLDAGQCLLLRGDNGAGKTTLAKILAGLLQPDALEVSCNGRRVVPAERTVLLRKTCLYLHQQPYLFDSSVFDNIAYGLRRRAIASNAIRERVDNGLDWGGLAHLAERNAKALSGGERQRVALIRARVLQPPVLLLDEPTNGMDSAARQQALQLIVALREEGVSIVLVSHDYRPDMQFADLELCLSGGCLHSLDKAPGAVLE